MDTNLPRLLIQSSMNASLSALSLSAERRGIVYDVRRSGRQSGQGTLMPSILVYAIIWPMCSWLCAIIRIYARRFNG